MFGMSSTEFWEEDPQLYWAYRIFYLKQREVEQLDAKYNIWLKGSINHLATSLAINNNFSKNKNKFPTYEELFEDAEVKPQSNKKLTRKEIDNQVQAEYIAWARY